MSEQLKQCRESLLKLVDDDAASYRVYQDARRSRDAAVAAGAAGIICECPANVARLCEQAIRTLHDATPFVRTIHEGEVFAAAELLRAAVSISWANLRANARLLGRDDASKIFDVVSTVRVSVNELSAQIQSQLDAG